MAFLGLYLVACVLLVGAGGAKLVRPHDTARSMKELTPRGSVRGWARLVRLLAAVEAVLGILALAYPSRVVAALVGASFVAFAGFVGYARAKGGSLATCGCFGTPDTPPTVVHAVVDLGLGAGAVAVAWSARRGPLTSLLAHQYGHGLPLVAASALCAWLAYLAMSALPRLEALRHSPLATPGGGS